MEKQKSALSRKIKTTSVVQQVIDAITMAIINKELTPGSKIPTEMELSESLGIGRLSIREAIKVLIYYGILEIRRPEGTFVCQGFSENLIDPALYGIILNTDESYAHIKELRLLMEVSVIKLAIKKSSEKDKERLKARYYDLSQAISETPCDPEKVFKADNDFHRVVSEMGGNPLIDKINSLVRLLTHEIRHKEVTKMVVNGKGETLLIAHQDLCNIILNCETENIEERVSYGYFYDQSSE